MEYIRFVQTGVLFDLLLLSASLFILSGKLGWNGRWKAWIPGLRFYCLGASVDMSREGVYCGIMDFLFTVSMFAKLCFNTGYTGRLFSLIHFVLFIYVVIYRVRIYLQIIRLFALKRKWLLLCIVPCIPYFILGIKKKYQADRRLLIEEDAYTSSEPKQEKSGRLCDFVPISNEGLSVHIRERIVSEFGKKACILKDVAMNIPTGSLVLLLGGSGAGKTTLVNAMIGYEQADATILVNGTDVYNNYESIRHKIGFVPQQNLIRGKDTVIKTVKDSARLRLPKSVSRKKRNEKTKEVMELLGLATGQGGLVSKKSGGQLRRICIATELVNDPELFVLDEPDSGLDGAISREIFAKLRRIADEGRIVIVITHTPDRVIDLFDKVIVLAKDKDHVGRLAFYGSPDQAKEFFGKESMEEIVMSINSKDEGGEGRADEFIQKYAAAQTSSEGGLTS